MTRRRGRPARHYHLRVRTERRHPIDFDALARAALEQAAMDQQRNDPQTPARTSARDRAELTRKERRHDDLE